MENFVGGLTKMREVRLSAKRLGEAVGASDQEKRFTFIVGKDERQYECSLVQACFISAKVCRLVASDSTIGSLRLLPNENCSEFELVENLWKGGCISVSKSNVDALSKLGEELENEELNVILVDFNLSNEEVSVENCISRLRLKTRTGLDVTEEIDFLAANFFEFETSNLSSLRVNELESVLVHESLQIETENALFDFISELAERDSAYSSLLKYVQFEYLDSEHLELFFESVYQDRIESVLWESITKFITKSVSNSPPRIGSGNTRFVCRERKFEYNSASPFNGIVAYLRSECGGNPHEKGIMSITASSNSYNTCHQVVDYGWNNYWHTGNVSNSWIQFDFQDRWVSLESYSLKSDGSVYHLQTWIIQGSNDASSWTDLDSRNTSELNGKYITKHFTCSHEANGKQFRYIRLTQTGTDSSRCHHLMLSEVELFGTLKL